MASSDAFSELPNFALEGDFPEDVELIPTQQLFFSKRCEDTTLFNEGFDNKMVCSSIEQSISNALNVPHLR
jgi:hypothetical protein